MHVCTFPWPVSGGQGIVWRCGIFPSLMWGPGHPTLVSGLMASALTWWAISPGLWRILDNTSLRKIAQKNVSVFWLEPKNSSKSFENTKCFWVFFYFCFWNWVSCRVNRPGTRCVDRLASPTASASWKLGLKGALLYLATNCLKKNLVKRTLAVAVMGKWFSCRTSF